MEILIPDPAEQTLGGPKDFRRAGTGRGQTGNAGGYGPDSPAMEGQRSRRRHPGLYEGRPGPLPLLDTMTARIRTLIDWIAEND